MDGTHYKIVLKDKLYISHPRYSSVRYLAIKVQQQQVAPHATSSAKMMGQMTVPLLWHKGIQRHDTIAV